MNRREDILRELEDAYTEAEEASENGDGQEAANQYSIIQELEDELEGLGGTDGEEYDD